MDMKKIEAVAKEIRTATLGEKNENVRFEKVAAILGKSGLAHKFVGEKPAAGAVGTVIKLKDRIRINYRCGYSKHNYAPCVEIFEN